jgi:hypothetical protein
MTRLRKMMLDEPGEALLSSSVVIIPRNSVRSYIYADEEFTR